MLLQNPNRNLEVINFLMEGNHTCQVLFLLLKVLSLCNLPVIKKSKELLCK